MKSAAILAIVTISALYSQNPESKGRFFAGNTPLTEPAAGRPEDIARRFLESTAADLSLSPDDIAGVFLAKQYQTDHNGVTHLVFRQQFQGIEVSNAEWVTNLDRNGAVVSAGGNLYANPTSPGQAATGSSLSAVRSAVKAVNPRLGAAFIPMQTARVTRRADEIVFAAGDFGSDIEGRLV